MGGVRSYEEVGHMVMTYNECKKCNDCAKRQVHLQRSAPGKVQQRRCKYSDVHLARCNCSGVHLVRGANAKVVTVKVQAITDNIQVAIVKP